MSEKPDDAFNPDSWRPLNYVEMHDEVVAITPVISAATGKPSDTVYVGLKDGSGWYVKIDSDGASSMRIDPTHLNS